MAFGFWHNVLEQAASTFKQAGKPFQDAFKYAKLYIKDREAADTFIRRKRENRMFKRAEPFVQQLPTAMKPTQALFTPTTLMLRDKHQYLFKVTFRYSDKPLEEYQYLSFITNDELTVREAERRMGDILDQHMRAGKYQHLQTISMTLRGTRTSMWLP